MKPYYEHAGITIYHGDCREILPHLPKVAITVTSPPYNTLPCVNRVSGLHAERPQWTAKASCGYFDQRPEDEYQAWLCGIVGECMRVSRGLVWVNHKVRYRNGFAVHPIRFLPYPIYAEVIWNRRGSLALNCKRYAPSHELILGFGKPEEWNNSLNTLMSVWDITPQLESIHPCPFPQEIPHRLIASSCPQGGCVLDPFMGIGTTLCAAKDLNRKAIGIDIEERYCEIAAKRLAQDVLNFDAIRTREPVQEVLCFD